MTDHPDDGALAAARRTLARLLEQGSLARDELARLTRDLAQAKNDFDDTRAAQLLEANERLVLSAVQARALADTALANLDALSRASQFDELTGTPNRALTLDRIASAIAQARRHGTRLAVLFLDIDKFKQVNDTLGHAGGDLLLRQFASRVTESVRETDTVGRFGGDEFVVLLTEVSAELDVALVSAKILAALARPEGDGEPVPTPSASIGIAFYPDDADTPDMLIQCADAAMYRSKRRGPGSFEFASHAVSTRAGPGVADEPGTAPPSVAQQRLDLRKANEYLMISAVAAHSEAEDTRAAHARQLKYIAMVAHELRNPLMPLRTVADLLRATTADTPTLDKVQAIIRRQVTYLSRLVEDLLDGARASTGKFRLDRTDVDLTEVILQAIEIARPAMNERRQDFSAKLEPGALHVEGDAMRLVQLISNLLDNASKYTATAGIIKLEVAATAEAITIAITDNGIGITAGALPRIFDLFVQESRARVHRDGGLGIGLAIVREMAEAHGGSVVAHSPGTGLGSEFLVTLPRKMPPVAALAV